MTRICLLLLLLIADPLLASEYVGQVVTVHDGDTFTLRTQDGVKRRMRLDGADAPERTQPYNQVSRRNLEALVANQTITATGDKVDRYGRPVVLVINGSGVDVGLEQIKAGLAWHFKRYELEQSPENRAAYAAAELIARSARHGLWRDPNPEAPWDFRARMRVPIEQ